MASVYLATCAPTGRQYIGFTTRSPAERWRRHVQQAEQGGGYLLHAAIRKHGAEAFTVRELAGGLPAEVALELEIAAIEAYGTQAPGGLNLTGGGQGGAPSDVVREKLRRPKSAETRRRMSEAGRRRSAEHRRRLGAVHLGKAKSPSHVAKMAARTTAQFASQEARDRHSAACGGDPAVRAALVSAVLDSGQSVAAASRSLGVLYGTAKRWVRQAKKVVDGESTGQ